MSYYLRLRKYDGEVTVEEQAAETLDDAAEIARRWGLMLAAGWSFCVEYVDDEGPPQECAREDCDAFYMGIIEEPPADWQRIVANQLGEMVPRVGVVCPLHRLLPGGGFSISSRGAKPKEGGDATGESNEL